MGLYSELERQSLFDKINSYNNRLSFYENNFVKDIFVAANFKQDGKINNAPHWSVRGHIAELFQQYTLAMNITSNFVNPNRFGISSDKVGINAPLLKKNNPLSDIIVIDKKTNTIDEYQAKYAKTFKKSLEAATKQKYVNNNVIPLIPQNDYNLFDTIKVNADGKVITSDALSINQANRLTSLLRTGYMVDPVANKKDILYKNAMSISTSTALISSFRQCLSNEIVKAFKEGGSTDGFSDFVNNFTKSSLENVVRNRLGTSMTLKTGMPNFSNASTDVIVNLCKNLFAYYKGDMTSSEFFKSIPNQIFQTSISTLSKSLACRAVSSTISLLSKVKLGKLIPIAGVTLMALLFIGVDTSEIRDLEAEELKRVNEICLKLSEEVCKTTSSIFTWYYDCVFLIFEDVILINKREFDKINQRQIETEIYELREILEELIILKQQLDVEENKVDFITVKEIEGILG